MFHDRARIYVEGGRGGDGVVSFRREAHVPRGGPDGGDGGRGGDVVLVADPSRRDLASMRVSAHHRAGRGGHGRGANRHGARGEDLVVPVPPGTTIEGLERESFDLVEPGQRAVVAAGGLGGHGNRRFADSTRQAPRFAEKGLAGRSGWIELRLRLLADAGLVGLPNAGKSSLLARITRAAPKVGDYPFTTVSPVLGTLDDGDRQLVIADIPGLIEGAAEGAGLGHEFLAHVERCRMLIHLVALGPGTDPDADHAVVRGELAAHGAGLERLPELTVLSKSDLLPAPELERVLADWRRRHPGSEPLAVSAATGAGIDDLVAAIFRDAAAAPEPGTAPGAPGFEAEHRLYRPAGADGFDVALDEDGVYEVRGRGVEMLVGRHDLANPEALAYLERRLREIGVVKALRDAGFEAGDEVRIGDHLFDLE
ncbi:MAG: GTPase ObgE [Acidobacteria bacterium]|nr:MAG: GTPase ObgE [Acidobacteriota bacterium]MCL4287404.1 GTPase ObgE [Thermoleophilia bacterium]